MRPLFVSGRVCAAVAVSAVAAAGVAVGEPLGTAFTYQGELRSAGVPVTGAHDLRFRLYDAASGGAGVGTTLCADNVDVHDGRFTVSLDFGTVFAGQKRFLEIEVRADTGLACSNPVGFVILGPRQEVSGSPNAIFASNAAAATTAATATNATQLNGQPASFYTNAANLTAGALPSARLAGTYTGSVTFSNAANAFSGSGAGLAALNAANISSGTLPDARLSSNVALLSGAQTISGSKSFAVAPAFAAPGQPFTVSAPGLVSNLNADMLDGLHSAAFLQAIPNPLALSGPSGSYIIRAENTSGVSGSAALLGVSTATGGTAYGVWGQTANPAGIGVYAEALGSTGFTFGVYGRNWSSAGTGVWGHALSSTGESVGVIGTSQSSGGLGVLGVSTATTGVTYGVDGRTFSTSGTGTLGYASASSGQTQGVYGVSDSTTGRGVYGVATSSTGRNYGAFFHSSSSDGTGVHGEVDDLYGDTNGVYGTVNSQVGQAVRGSATATAGVNYGGYFECVSPFGDGVFGNSTATSGASAWGVEGRTASTEGRGVYGLANASTGVNYGVYGASYSVSGRGVFGSGVARGVEGQTSGSAGTGVFGAASATSGFAFGVYGESNSTSGRGVSGWALASTGGTIGVEGFANSSSGYGVRGEAGGGAGFGVWAQGKLGASGVKSFRIDHPDDPENRFLLHYSAESPDVINFYSDTVTLDDRGEAEVELPRYFAKINLRPRYQLTPVGAPMPMLHIAEKISDEALSAGAVMNAAQAAPLCRFRIAGGSPGGEVSWEVKAVRNDRWVQRHGAPVEVTKQGAERGAYQHPELYGQPADKALIRAERKEPTSAPVMQIKDAPAR